VLGRLRNSSNSVDTEVGLGVNQLQNIDGLAVDKKVLSGGVSDRLTISRWPSISTR
jgi:hypothetical protein